MEQKRKKALVVGALGIIGRNLIDHLSSLNDWEIVGLSRRSPDFKTKAQFIPVNLLDPDDCREKLSGLHDITHIFYTAFQARPTWAEHVAPNLAMLTNVVEAVEPIASDLKHVCLMQGYKVYGAHLGQFKTPAKESDSRHMPPEFYYAQEDFLRQQQQGKAWTWSALRPATVCGFAVGNPMNLAVLIAVYAAISKELGIPLRYPGNPIGYTKLVDMTDSTLLAKATVWAATEPKCGNEALNIANGDLF
jgi:nucleoside-diphosphate-sugar epimerase